SGKGTPIRVTMEMPKGSGSAAGFSVLNDATQTLAVDEGREGALIFRVRAGRKPGGSGLRFTARAGGRTSATEQSVSVRPATPYRTTTTSGILLTGKTDIPVERRLFSEFRAQRVSVSHLPLALADGLNHYLTRFPYG